MTYDYIIVHIEGGLGKHIAATAVVQGVAEYYNESKVIVVCSFPEVFLWNPNAHRVYVHGSTTYFYDDYIKNKNTLVLKHNPYDCTNHIYKRQSLIESWFEVFGIPYSGQQPTMYTNFKFEDIAVSKFYRSKPIMVIHTNGGPYDASDNYDKNLISSWTRDIPTAVANNVIQTYKDKYHIFQICKSKQNVLTDAEAIVTPTYNQELFNLLRLSEKRLLIDSSLQHAAAALKLPSTVLWVGTDPKVFGYDIHNNITPKIDTPTNHKNIKAYLYDYELYGDPIQCPYPSSDLFDTEMIIGSLA